MNYLYIVALFFCLLACDSKSSGLVSTSNSQIDDLPFQAAEHPKQYADLILRALKTNRKQPIYDQMLDRAEINVLDFNRWISMYSTAITGRNDWEFRDIYEENNKKIKDNGFDYAWLDPKGRLGLQVYILPEKIDNGYKVRKIEFRSRLEVMESIAIPGGEIDNYKKLNYNWDKPLPPE